MGEGLVVDPQLKLVSVLHNHERILCDGEGEVEGSLVAAGKGAHLRVFLIYYLSILGYLFLARNNAVEELDRVVVALKGEFPRVLFLRPRVRVCTYDLMVFPTSSTS